MNLPLLLNITIFLPLAGVITLLFFPKEKDQLIKIWALFISVVTFLLSIPLFCGFRSDSARIQFETLASWIPAIGANYRVGLDGISILLFMLTTFMIPIAILASFSTIHYRVKEYMISFLFLETGMLGVFSALDLLLFYIFWEAMLIPMYLIIGVWGGPRRIYAALKFVIYTMVGSALMLAAILYLYFTNHNFTGTYTFDILKMYQLGIPFGKQVWLFLAFALAFAIKVPVFPLHTWLPDAHVEAPTAGSIILAAVLLKMGTYGFLRFNLPIFPEATLYFTPLFFILAVIGILYGALVSMVQDDIKKLVAYSSVAHLGFVMLGIFAMTTQSLQGGIIQMVNHGLSTGALFLAVGMIYERRHTRLIDEFGGISKSMPIFASLFMIVCLSSLGLPGTNGFVGEFLILIGTFMVNKTFAVLGTAGIILAAVYLLWMYKRMMFGTITREENRKLIDLDLREIVALVSIILFIFWIGIYPHTFTQKSEASVQHLIQRVEKAELKLQQERRVWNIKGILSFIIDHPSPSGE